MTTPPHPPLVLATLEACEQYRYRVEFPDVSDAKARDEIFRSALREVSETFLECTRNFQSVAWIGQANLSFADSKCSPSDRKSKFLHMLVCLKAIESRVLSHQAGDSGGFKIKVRTALPREFRKKLEKLCKRYDIAMESCEEDVDAAGVVYSGSFNQETFVIQPLHAIETFHSNASRMLSGRTRLKAMLKQVTACLTLSAGIYQFFLRGAFSLYYNAAAKRVLKRMDGSGNVFLYFEVRSGTNREVEPYLRWKYGSEFISTHEKESSIIPFTHLAGANAAFSLQAMIWARRALLRMEQQPADGCVVVNFLLTPVMMWKLRSRRTVKRDKIDGRLRKFLPRGGDFIPGIIYREFREMLADTNAFAMEMAKCYQQFFTSLEPGVVIQADALSKGARQLTTCARKRGGKVIYLADRVCTALRTSNQLVKDDGDNPHIPDRCVVFDAISKQELIRQGFADTRIYHYHRNFEMPSGEEATPPLFKEIRVLLQDYMDNLSVLISTGVELAREFADLTVVFQEHPDFPVDDGVKARLLAELPGRIRFPKRGEITDYKGVLAMLTGYSTAAVPGVLLGLPLIWLRRQVDNSVYGEAYLERIGFAADSTDEVLAIIRQLRSRDPGVVAASAAGAVAAREIFSPSPVDPDRTLAYVLNNAAGDCFSDLSQKDRA